MQAAWKISQAERAQSLPDRTRGDRGALLSTLRGWLASRLNPRSGVPALTSQADRIFLELCTEARLQQWMVALPLRDLPRTKAIAAVASQARVGFDAETVLYSQIRRDWPGLTERDRRVAAHIYLRCLQEAAEPA